MKLSHIDPKDFARSLLDILAEGQDGSTIERILAGIESVPSDSLRRQLKALVDQGATDVEKLREAIEKWFDNQMASLTRWYRRRTRWVSFSIGVLVALVFNVNAIAVAQELWENTAVRDAALAVATEQLSNDFDALKETGCDSADNLLGCAEDKVGELVDIGLPFGWPCTQDTCDTPRSLLGNAWNQAGDGDFGAVAYRVLGWLLAAGAFSVGGSFWYDALKRVAGLRAKAASD